MGKGDPKLCGGGERGGGKASGLGWTGGRRSPFLQSTKKWVSLSQMYGRIQILSSHVPPNSDSSFLQQQKDFGLSLVMGETEILTTKSRNQGPTQHFDKRVVATPVQHFSGTYRLARYFLSSDSC